MSRMYINTSYADIYQNNTTNTTYAVIHKLLWRKQSFSPKKTFKFFSTFSRKIDFFRIVILGHSYVTKWTKTHLECAKTAQKACTHVIDHTVFVDTWMKVKELLCYSQVGKSSIFSWLSMICCTFSVGKGLTKRAQIAPLAYETLRKWRILAYFDIKQCENEFKQRFSCPAWTTKKASSKSRKFGIFQNIWSLKISTFLTRGNMNKWVWDANTVCKHLKTDSIHYSCYLQRFVAISRHLQASTGWNTHFVTLEPLNIYIYIYTFF